MKLDNTVLFLGNEKRNLSLLSNVLHAESIEIAQKMANLNKIDVAIIDFKDAVSRAAAIALVSSLKKNNPELVSIFMPVL